MAKHTAAAISERRQKLWTCLTKGMKTYEIAKELNTDHSTISRDIKYLTAQSQNYLNNLAKETLPFMYQTSIEGIREVIRECCNIYETDEEDKLAVLKLIKECHESVFKLVDEGQSVMYVKQLQEKLIQIESRSLR